MSTSAHGKKNAPSPTPRLRNTPWGSSVAVITLSQWRVRARSTSATTSSRFCRKASWHGVKRSGRVKRSASGGSFQEAKGFRAKSGQNEEVPRTCKSGPLRGESVHLPKLKHLFSHVPATRGQRQRLPSRQLRNRASNGSLCCRTPFLASEDSSATPHVP